MSQAPYPPSLEERKEAFQKLPITFHTAEIHDDDARFLQIGFSDLGCRWVQENCRIGGFLQIKTPRTQKLIFVAPPTNHVFLLGSGLIPDS